MSLIPMNNYEAAWESLKYWLIEEQEAASYRVTPTMVLEKMQELEEEITR